VSDKTVRNWIEGARKGKNDLVLFDYADKWFVADVLENEGTLEKLVESGRKYRNGRTYKEVSPVDAFYKLYTQKQVIDIAHNLEKYSEYPLHYRYDGAAATYWSTYLQRLYDSDRSNYLTATIDLLQTNRSYLDSLLVQYQQVDVVDIGVGNGLAVKGLLSHLVEKGMLRKYIGIDISKDLLDLTTHNLRAWFGSSLQIETHVRDITNERFFEQLATDSSGGSCVNLVLFLGGAVTNFKEPDTALKTIRDSMGKNDLLISTIKLDQQKTQRFFDFNIASDKAILPMQSKMALDLLSIRPEFYGVEQFFDKQHKSRFVQARLRSAISIRFDIGDFKKTVTFQKGEAIILVRVWHFTTSEIALVYQDSGFYQLQTTSTQDKEYLMIVSTVDTEKDTFLEQMRMRHVQS
jgi:uncharacterized SAM-dependent methyltransferase